jgi:hypothetical protein
MTAAAAGEAGPRPARMVMVRDMATDTDMELPLAELLADDDRYRVLVWDGDRGEFMPIHRLEAVVAMFDYADTLGPGTWACWAASERAVELLRDDAPWNRRLRQAGSPVSRPSR